MTVTRIQECECKGVLHEPDCPILRLSRRYGEEIQKAPDWRAQEKSRLPEAFIDGFVWGILIGAFVGALLFGGLLEVVCNP